MKILVTVLPKDEVSDPQGEAIHAAARTLGFAEVTGLRAGRCFLLEVADGTGEDRIRALADGLLANPTVETFRIERQGQ